MLFNVGPLEEGELVRQLQPLVHQPYSAPENESLDIEVGSKAREGMEAGTLYLSDPAIERFQLVADILGKSTVLAMYESKVTRSFDLIEPFAGDLERNSWSGRNARELLRHIGAALISEHTLVGRVEVTDKPEIIWEHPDLERSPAAGRRIRDPRAAHGSGAETDARFADRADGAGAARGPPHAARGVVHRGPDRGGDPAEHLPDIPAQGVRQFWRRCKLSGSVAIVKTVGQRFLRGPWHCWR